MSGSSCSGAHEAGRVVGALPQRTGVDHPPSPSARCRTQRYAAYIRIDNGSPPEHPANTTCPIQAPIRRIGLCVAACLRGDACRQQAARTLPCLRRGCGASTCGVWARGRIAALSVQRARGTRGAGCACRCDLGDSLKPPWPCTRTDAIDVLTFDKLDPACLDIYTNAATRYYGVYVGKSTKARCNTTRVRVMFLVSSGSSHPHAGRALRTCGEPTKATWPPPLSLR